MNVYQNILIKIFISFEKHLFKLKNGRKKSSGNKQVPETSEKNKCLM